MLYYTSFVFGIMSYATTGTWMQTAYSLLMGLSILNHAKFEEDFPGKKVVKVADICVAHTIALSTLWKATYLTILSGQLLYPYYGALGYVTGVYYFYTRDEKPGWKKWHATIHLVSCLGTYYLLEKEKAYHHRSTSN